MKPVAMEKWRTVAGFPGYLVSTSGRVYSGRSNKCLAPQPSGAGHLRVTLRRDGRSHLNLVHRLVLNAWVGPCPKGLECLHRDDDPTNNHVANLRWGTRSENRLDAVRNQRLAGGRQRGQSLERAQVRQIKLALRANATHASLARVYHVSATTIGKIKRGELWADVL